MTRSYRRRIFFIIALGIFSALVMLLLPRFPQNIHYHDFADKREAFGIPNFGDVIGNLAFMAAGLAGIAATWKRRRDFIFMGEPLIWMVFFSGSFLVALGSGYYHLNPNNHTLVWDRIPMTIAFMSLFSLIIMERISARAGLMLFPLLLIAGVDSVLYWDYTESMGHGDLRPYALVQFFPMVAILLMLWLFPARYSGTKYLGYMLGWYVLAKILEYFDRGIFSLTDGLVSGHTLKHLAAAIAVGYMVRYVARRMSAGGLSLRGPLVIPGLYSQGKARGIDKEGAPEGDNGESS